MTTQIGGVLFGGAKASFFGVLVQIGLSIYFAAPYGWLSIVVAIVYVRVVCRAGIRLH